MAVAPTNLLLDDILDFLASTPTLQQIIDFRPSDALSNRLHYVLDENGEGRITREERAELDEFLRVNHLMNTLKLRARRKLASS